MDLNELKNKIKEIPLSNGAKLVGIGSAERLKDTPPSGDMTFCLPGAQSCIIWVFPYSHDALKNFFSKKERRSIAKEQYEAYSLSWKIANEMAEFIEQNSEYKAFPLIPNGQYRKGMGLGMESLGGKIKKRLANVVLKLGVAGKIVSRNLAKVFGRPMVFPDFSLRYGAVAAGLGHLGWSGNLVTEEYGGALHLGGVLTTAPLEPDPMAPESNCNKCKLCVKVCNSGFFSLEEEEEPVMIGGQAEVYSKRNVFGRCGLGCGGWTGLGADGEWSTWSPNHISLANVPEEDMKSQEFLYDLMRRLMYDKETPEEVQKFNRKLVADINKGGLFVNVGLRTLENTNPPCGFCSMICVEDFELRKELHILLKQSGKMFVDKEGKEYIKKIDESGNETIYCPPTAEEYEKGIS